MKRMFMEDSLFIEDKNEFHAPTPVGKTRTMTPEGFLLCEGVQIARTGEQLYAAKELTDNATGKPVVEPGPDGTVIIGREPDEVFRDESIKSFEGKPVTVEHPNEFVNPENWKRVAVGTTHNVRQGEGADKDFLIADLLITDKGAIEHVNRDMPQISCGYDSEYEQVEPGKGLQRNIVGNHVALVDRGRAGPRCSIRDSAAKHTANHVAVETLGAALDEELDEDELVNKRTIKDSAKVLLRIFNFQPEIKQMAKVKIIDRLMSLLTAVKTKDQAALDKVLTEDEDGDDPMGETFGSMDKKFEDWMKSADKKFEDWMKSKDAASGSKEADGKVETEKEADKEAKAVKEAEDTIIMPETTAKNPDMMGRVWVGDSVAPFVKDIINRAEILAPGIAVPTTDAVSQKGLKNFMLTALLKAASTKDGAECIAPFVPANQKLETMDGRTVLAVFNGAAEVRRVKNNATFRPTAVKTADFGKPVSVQDIQAMQDEYWGKGKKASK